MSNLGGGNIFKADALFIRVMEAKMLREEKPAARVRVCGDLARFVDCDELETQSGEAAVVDAAAEHSVMLDNVLTINAVLLEEAA